MALSCTHILLDYLDQQVSIDDCYVKVSTVKGSKIDAIAEVEIFNANKLRIDHRFYNFDVNMDGHNFIKQAYLHLKTLPEFADATDC
jgi:hypothetical protein